MTLKDKEDIQKYLGEDLFNEIGDFYASGDARLPKVLIPMIRRTFPPLIASEIVGVQPMSGPTGLAFKMRYKYDSIQKCDETIAQRLGKEFAEELLDYEHKKQ